MVNSQFNFEPQPEGQSTTQCLSIPIIDDEVLETTEMFTIELQSTSPNVSANPSANSAMVVIMDNDSMCSTCTVSSNNLLHTLLGVGIGINEPAYSVGESESSVTICATITSGEAAIPVEVVLMTVSDGNACGKLIHGCFV